MVLFLLAAVLLTLLVLIQKGRGGGLAGAFGGPGGHSAFGTQTADVLIKATAVLGALFFLLSIVTALVMSRSGPTIETPATEQAPREPGGPPSTEAPPPAPEAPSPAPAPTAPAPTAPSGASHETQP
jgi:preprotein translocase subunit SecG